MDRSPTECDRLTKDIQRTAQHARSKNLTWRPHVSENTPGDVCSQCLIHGATGFSVSTISDAIQLASTDAASIFVSLPPAFSEVKIIGSIQQSTTMLLTIDHFVQAEEIAKHNSDHRNEQQVVILLQGNQPGPGVRPGLDALRLAQGINSVPGIRVVGLSATLTNDRDAQPAIKSAAHTQTMLHNSGIDCDFISLSGSADLLRAEKTVVTEIRDPHLNFASPMMLPAGDFTAEVISRPSLEIAILNGSDAFQAAIGCLRLPDFPTAEVSPGPDNCCVVTTNGDALRLKIGDRVRIQHSVVPDSSG
jgi:D-serine deaminase-like pyridoxal phosphate-dependent protein